LVLATVERTGDPEESTNAHALIVFAFMASPCPPQWRYIRLDTNDNDRNRRENWVEKAMALPDTHETSSK
jgi:hypothetical protein